jgi:hypothetical protein
MMTMEGLCIGGTIAIIALSVLIVLAAMRVGGMSDDAAGRE